MVLAEFREVWMAREAQEVAAAAVSVTEVVKALVEGVAAAVVIAVVIAVEGAVAVWASVGSVVAD